jgi:hypothetical protein
MMITPKHFARELDVEPRIVRMLLRTRFGKPDKKYWLWDEREAKAIKKWLAQSLGKKVGVR